MLSQHCWGLSFRSLTRYRNERKNYEIKLISSKKITFSCSFQLLNKTISTKMTYGNPSSFGGCNNSLLRTEIDLRERIRSYRSFLIPSRYLRNWTPSRYYVYACRIRDLALSFVVSIQVAFFSKHSTSAAAACIHLSRCSTSDMASSYVRVSGSDGVAL